MENNKYHILIVDDDTRISNLLHDYLTENKYIVSTAENANQAKEKIKYLKFEKHTLLIILIILQFNRLECDTIISNFG